jgi:hypothetical protein
MEEIKEEVKIEGEKPKEHKGVVMQTIFLILLMFAVAGLVAALITVHRYADMLTNPVGYNMEKFGLMYCSCYNTNGEIVPITNSLYNDSKINYGLNITT